VAVLGPYPHLPYPPRVPAGNGSQDGGGGHHREEKFYVSKTSPLQGIHFCFFNAFIVIDDLKRQLNLFIYFF
jgi:hypothetical protein